MSYRRSHRSASKSHTRLACASQKIIALREKAKASTAAFLARRQRQIAWWQRAFRTPLVGFYGWVRSQCNSACSALMMLLGLVAKPQLLARSTSSRHSHYHRRQSTRRRLRTESLEARALLATVSDGGGTTLTISLATDEDLAVVSNGTTYSFSSDMNFTKGVVANVGDFSAFGGTSLTLEASGLARYNTVSVVDSGTNSTVTFSNSGGNKYADQFTVLLANASAGAITFNGATAFDGSNSLSASTTKNIVVSSGSSVSTVGGNLTLEANQQSTPTTASFVGINVYNATVNSTGSGNVLLKGRGGDTGTENHGVQVLLGGFVSGGGTVTVEGTGGASTGAANFGVQVTDTNSTITSSAGAVLVKGLGGGSGGSSGSNHGVIMVQGGVIRSNGTGAGATVTVEGTGGNTGSTNNNGV